MKWLDTLSLIIAITFGVSLGVLIMDAAGGAQLSRDAILVLWAGITGLFGAALGAGIAVKGGLQAAKQQIDAAKAENIRRDHILVRERELNDKTDRLEVLLDFSAILMPFLASIEIVSRQATLIKSKKQLEVSSITTLRTLFNEIENLITAEAPTSRVHGPSVRRQWALLRHVIRHIKPRLEEICKETDENTHSEFVVHIYDTAYPNMNKRGEEMRILVSKRAKELTDEMDNIRSELRSLYQK